ncbi:hypothetical protein N7522_013777 [Penicillium canescens]|nr:hypothetical protein N7522_013777 [Penicillium canescens]
MAGCVAQAIVSASGPEISSSVQEKLEYYDDDDDDATMRKREKGKTLYKPAFSSGTDEQL